MLFLIVIRKQVMEFKVCKVLFLISTALKYENFPNFDIKDITTNFRINFSDYIVKNMLNKIYLKKNTAYFS